MELLPLVEMYCKWELQDDCSNLRELMVRFDSEAELETHELGRSLLLMLRDDDAGMPMYTPRMVCDAPSNPFDSIRSRLAEIDTAFRALQPQVRLPVDINFERTLAGMPAMAFGMPNCLFPPVWRNKNYKFRNFLCSSFSRFWLDVVCLASSFASSIHLPLACIMDLGRARSHILCHFWRRCASLAFTRLFFGLTCIIAFLGGCCHSARQQSTCPFSPGLRECAQVPLQLTQIFLNFFRHFIPRLPHSACGNSF